MIFVIQSSDKYQSLFWKKYCVDNMNNSIRSRHGSDDVRAINGHFSVGYGKRYIVAIYHTENLAIS